MLDIPWEEEQHIASGLFYRTVNHPMEPSYCKEREQIICPFCNEGKIRSYCEPEKDHGNITAFHVTHVCDVCGCVVDESELCNDVEWKRPTEQSDAVPTLLGDFRAECRGRFLPLRYRSEDCDLSDGFGHADLHVIDADISSCQVGDEVSVGLEPGLLVAYNSIVAGRFETPT